MVLPRDNRPNILLILTDQQRYDTLGCYGSQICRTPHADALAARGVRFDRAYATTVPCSPSRATLFTGLYPHKHNVRHNALALDPSVPNLASELRPAGYNLGYAGKWHVDVARQPTGYGFEGKDFPGYGYPVADGLVSGLRFGPSKLGEAGTNHYERYLREHGYPVPRLLEAHYGDNPGTQWQEVYALQSGGIESSFECMVAEDTLQLLQALQQRRDREGSPFFLWTNFWGPHTPCLLPEPYFSMYDPKSIPEEPSFGETWERKPYVQQLVERYWGLSKGGWPRWREIVARYWGYVTMIDDLVGRILAGLSALNAVNNTVVIFATDHGDMMGAHRLIEKGPFTYEQCYRIPLVVAHPDCTVPGIACNQFVHLADLFPTILSMAGRLPSAVPDSCSFQDLLLGNATSPGRQYVYTQFFTQIFPYEQRMLRTHRHKFVYNRCDIGELYDLDNDPSEMRNLFGLPEARGLQAELMDIMRAEMVRLGDPILASFDAIRTVYY